MKLILITWPSWSWKTTLQNQLIETYSSDYSKLILTTCRSPRINKNWNLIEHDWQDYHFLDNNSFWKKDLLFRFWTYWISKETWELWENNSIINTLACWFSIANFFFNLRLKNLGIIFMNTTYQECYKRMLIQRWDIIEIEKRMKIFDLENKVRDISNITIEPDYTLSVINSMIQQILK